MIFLRTIIPIFSVTFFVFGASDFNKSTKRQLQSIPQEKTNPAKPIVSIHERLKKLKTEIKLLRIKIKIAKHMKQQEQYENKLVELKKDQKPYLYSMTENNITVSNKRPSVLLPDLNEFSVQFKKIDKDQDEILSLVLDNNAKIQQSKEEERLRVERIANAKRQAKEAQRLRDEKIEKQILEAEKQRLEVLRQEQIRLSILEAQKARESRVTAHIDLSQQRMKVFLGENLIHTWSVSTARKGYVTPTGKYQPQFIERMHYSRLYHNSAMPYSIFFKGNFAIHGTRSIRRLGRRASHGCVRLHPKNAKKLYHLVRKYGKANTFINIVY